MILLVLSLWVAAARGQELEVPIDLQIPLLMKVMTFDRNMKARAGDGIVIGIAYQSGFRISLNTEREFVRVMGENFLQKIEDVPVNLVPIDIDKTDLGEALSESGVDILYITPLRNVKIPEITSLTRSKQIVTMTGVTAYVESGVAVGVGLKGGKPLVLVNRTAQQLECIDFSSQLLKLARIID
jgi:hypothetical protein